MAVLPWGQNRDKLGSGEQRTIPALDWFSKSMAEPSRVALAGLMKEHTRTVSSGSGSVGSRSRPNTSCSQRSHSRGEASSRLSTISSLDHRDSAAKSFFLRANGLKRKSSNISLMSEGGSPTGKGHAGRFVGSRLGFRRKEPSTTQDQSEIPGPTISKPFGFQHLTHTEPKHVNGLSTINEAELGARFNPIRSGPTGDTELRGIPTIPIAHANAPVKYATQPRVPSPMLTRTTPTLPTTPPPPTPPAKDSPVQRHLPRSEVRVSRSVENFSRPTPRSLTPVSPGHFIPTSLTEAAQALSLQTSAPTKTTAPSADRPRSPSAIHALSTQDNTARRMMNAPLPMLPPTPTRDDGHESSHKRQSSSQGSLRHMSTFPSSRHQKMTGDGQLIGIQEESEHATRTGTDDAFSRKLQAALCTPPRSRMLIDDWDVAIEDAWDQDEILAQQSDEPLATSSASRAKTPSTPGENTVPQPPSMPSTPGLTMKSARSLQSIREHSDTSSMELDYQFDTLSQLVGLGIESKPNLPSSRRSMLPPLEVTVPPLTDGLSPWARNCHSALSKSSSQDSIILSIASSLRGTQRSSNSSVGPDDLETYSATTCGSSPVTSFDVPKATRPESTCVPAALLRGFHAPKNVASIAESQEATSEHDETERDALAPLPRYEKHERTVSGGRIPVPQRTSSIHRSPGHRRTSTSSSRRHRAHGSYSLFPPATPPSAIR